MAVEIFFTVIVISFVVWLSRRPMRNVWTGECLRDEVCGPGSMPPSGPDIAAGSAVSEPASLGQARSG